MATLFDDAASETSEIRALMMDLTASNNYISPEEPQLDKV